MPIEFNCIQCGQRLRVPDSAAGKQARCPQCQAQMPVPGTPPGPGPAGGTPWGPAASNPFADSGAFETAAGGTSAAAGEAFNPYAAPLGLTDQIGVEAGVGLPWETEPMSLSAWWRTAKACLMEPSAAFASLRPGVDMTRAILFCGLGLLLGGLAQLVWVLPLLFLGAVVDGDPAATLPLQIVLQLVQTVIGPVVGATVGLLLGAAIVHGSLLIVGGASRPFETTLRVLGYVNGSTAWLSIIPCAGPLVALIWSLVIEVAGLAAAHRTSPGRAFLAVLLPILVCGLICGLGIGAMVLTLVQMGLLN